MTIASTLAVVLGALGAAGATGRHERPEPMAFEPQPARIAASVGSGRVLDLAPPPTRARLPTATPERVKPKVAKAKQAKKAPHSKEQHASEEKGPNEKKHSKKEPATTKPRTVERADRTSRRTAPPAEPDWVRPGTGYLSSGFGARWGAMHYGIDLAAPLGSPIYAAGDGVVLRAGPSSGFGLAICIQHANGDVTVYGHEYEVLVSAGQQVQAGQLIAHVGSEGQSTGPHLHFGVYQGGLEGPRIDPIPWLIARGVRI